jgi:hypothetical protein
MAASPLPTPPFSQQVLDGGFFSRAWQTWLQSVQTRLGGTFDKVEAAYKVANAAAPASAEVVAGAGLQGGGQVGPNVGLGLYLAITSVANLPTSAAEGDWAYAIDGRKAGEAAGSGTGVPVWRSNSGWYAIDSGAAVTN